MPIAISSNSFETTVLESELPVLVDFWGSTCMPCQMLKPVVAAVAEELQDKLNVCEFSVDRAPEETDAEFEEKFKLILKYNVMNLPTLLLFKKGTLEKTLIGFHTKKELLKELQDVGIDASATPAEPTDE
jgi:thioredoxin 1